MDFLNNELINTILLVCIGFAILLFGRRLFWVFVAVVGFILGYQIGTEIAPAEGSSLPLILGVVIGIVAAILAVAFQRVGIAIIGLIAGYYLVHQVVLDNGWADGTVAIALGAVGGAACAALLWFYYNWVIVIFSALFGAYLILEPFVLNNQIALLFFLLLVVFGVLYQLGYLSRLRFRRR